MSDNFNIGNPSAPPIINIPLEADDENDFSFQQQLEYAKQESLRELEKQNKAVSESTREENKTPNVPTPEPIPESAQEAENKEDVSQFTAIRVEKLPGALDIPYPRKSVYTQYLEGEVERLHGLMKELCEATDELQRADPILYRRVFGHLSFLETPHPGLDGSLNTMDQVHTSFTAQWDGDTLEDYPFQANAAFR